MLDQVSSSRSNLKHELLTHILDQPNFFCQNTHFLGFLIKESRLGNLSCSEETRQECWSSATDHVTKAARLPFEKQMELFSFLPRVLSGRHLDTVTNFLVENADFWVESQFFHKKSTVAYLLNSHHRLRVAGTPSAAVEATLRRAMEVLSACKDEDSKTDLTSFENQLALYTLQISFEDPRVHETMQELIHTVQTCLMDEEAAKYTFMQLLSAVSGSQLLEDELFNVFEKNLPKFTFRYTFTG